VPKRSKGIRKKKKFVLEGKGGKINRGSKKNFRQDGIYY
jgi:hypothetical protein